MTPPPSRRITLELSRAEYLDLRGLREKFQQAARLKFITGQNPGGKSFREHAFDRDAVRQAEVLAKICGAWEEAE